MGSPSDLPRSASLNITQELIDNLARESQALEEVQVYVIDSPEMAQIVNTQLLDIKRRTETVEHWDEAFAKPIRQLEATREALFGTAKKSLKQAEDFCKNLLKGWTEKERVRIATEKKAADDAARKARQEADQKAAAARAQGEEAARIAREKAAAAEAEQRKQAAEAERLRSEGDAKAAAEADRKAKAAAGERAKQEEVERQRIADGERKAAEAQLTVFAMPQPEVRGMTKLTGYSERKNWIAEFADDTTEEQALEKVIAAIAGVPVITGRRDLLSLVALEMKQANKWAKAQEGNFNVPGLRSRNAPISASKG